jgi:NADH-quinone oxidoreductase subunit E
MLSPEERKEIEMELPHYPYKAAVSIDALKIVQRHRGWVSDESIRDIAEFLDISPDELDGIATFYNLIYRKPMGRHVILICNSVSCWIMGYEHLRERLCQRLNIQLGETTTDGRFTLLPIVCLGACDHAPVLMIDGDLHRDVVPDSAERTLEKYR